MTQVLLSLLGTHEAEALLFASLATFHLASIPELREPLGVAGAVTALVAAVRR